MSGFVLHPAAVRDLEEIWDYIAVDSPRSAGRVMDEIYQEIQRLVSFPESGHLRADLTSRPVRFHTVRSYLIAYAHEEKALTVLAVLHGQRNPRVIAAILRDRP